MDLWSGNRKWAKKIDCDFVMTFLKIRLKFHLSWICSKTCHKINLLNCNRWWSLLAPCRNWPLILVCNDIMVKNNIFLDIELVDIFAVMIDWEPMKLTCYDFKICQKHPVHVFLPHGPNFEWSSIFDLWTLAKSKTFPGKKKIFRHMEIDKVEVCTWEKIISI